MTGITQTIPSFIAGISQQPDELKLAGQVSDLLNGIPDITDGLIKRPGSKYLANLSGATSDGAWFSYYRDEAEGAYIGQVDSSGNVRMWRASDGTAAVITNNSQSYLATAKENLKFLTVNDYTFVTNVTKTVEQSGNLSTARDYNYAFVELRNLVAGRQYSFDVSTPNGGTATLDGSGYGKAVEVDWNDPNENPWTTATVNPSIGGAARYDPTLPDVGSKIITATKDSTGTTTVSGRNIVVRVTITGQATVHENASGTIAPQDYTASYDRRIELLYGGNGWQVGDTFKARVGEKNVEHTLKVTAIAPIKGRNNIGSFRPKPTSFNAAQELSADTILSQFDSTGALGTNRAFTMTAGGQQVAAAPIGNGLVLWSAQPFKVTTAESDLWRIIQHEVNDPDLLPTQCKDGYIIKVNSSNDSQREDYYLRFVGNNGDGPGSWVETVAPGIKYQWDTSTLPVTIVRTGNLQFKVGPFEVNNTNAWTDRTVGDEVTNPTPSIVGNKISQTFFHRNRLGFLTNGNVVLSQAGDLGNFYQTSALIVAGDDPIDIAASSTVPTILRDAIETNTGLVIFADNQQFLLHTDSDSLTPETGKLSNISTYNYNITSRPISLGTSIGFSDNVGNFSRFFEMFDIRREGEPQIIDQSKVVQRLLPKGVNIVNISRENSTAFFVKSGTNNVYGYRYFNSGRERLQSAWFRWNLPFNILFTFVLDDAYYLVSSDYKLMKINLQQSSDTPIVNGVDLFDENKEYTVHLDSHSTINVPGGAYNSTTDLTAISKSSVNLIGSGTVALLTNDGGYATQHSADGSNYYFRGNFSGLTGVIGLLFTMQVEFPKIFVKKGAGQTMTADRTAALTIHRVQVSFGYLGRYEFELKRVGKGSYIEQYEATYMDHQDANEVPYASNVVKTIPVYERNSNCSLTFKSIHPSPAVIYAMSWEGDYTPMHYTRA